VAQACAARLCPCSLALGGKDAAIVLADAPLDRAANGIVWAALAGGGQTFGAIERVYVEEKVADAFIEKVKAAVAELRPGHDLSVITTEERRAEVAAQVAGAVAAGATILAGGATADRLMAPVVVKVTGDDIPLMRDPTRGPVLAIAVVADVEEAIARTNASRFGHAASIWSRNLARAERLAWRLRVGVVSINDHGRAESLPCVPWSGRGDSGYGVSGSAFALDLLTRPRFVLRAPARPRRERWWFPYTPGMRQALLARAVLGSGTSGWFRRIAALFRLAAGIFKRFRK
jgi:acyl-CoA reductase-like NAD-dependent aldehyde dehydrogenase